MKEKIAIGKIIKSHGIKGLVKVISLSGESEHFLKLHEIYLEKNNIFECLFIEEIKIANKYILIKFTGIDTPEKAKKMQGLYIWTERDNACKLKYDEYYLKDICSCYIIKKDKRIGKVKSVFEGGNAYNLEIILDNNKTVIIPFINQFIGEVKINEKKIYIKEDCGLI